MYEELQRNPTTQYYRETRKNPSTVQNLNFEELLKEPTEPEPRTQKSLTNFYELLKLNTEEKSSDYR